SITVIPVENAVAPGDSLAALLKTDSAVDVRERGPDGTQADVGIRGATFSQTLVLVDGIRVNDVQSGHHNLDLPLPLETVSRMEVLHGSGSTLYGSDATGGAINVITRRPEATELSLSSGLGDFGWNREAASGGFRLGRWSQQFGVSRDFSTGFRTGRDYRNFAAAGETFLDERFGSTSVLVAYNDRPFGANGFYGAYPSWEKTGTTLVAATQTAGDHRFTFSYRRHRDHYVLFRDQPDVFQNFHTDQSWEAGYAYHHAIAATTQFTGGLEAISESIASTNLGGHQRARASGYFVFEARPVARLTLTAGLREEVYRTWRGVASPTLAAGVRVAGGLKARASLGHAFRIPTYTELYYHDPANIGNPHLQPESAWTYEAGLDWWGPRGTTLSATWFERRERDTIDFVRPAGASIWQAMNFERLNFHGGQVEWRQKVRHAEVGASYTIIRASRELTPGVASQYVFDFPQNSVALTARAPLGRWAVGRMRLGAFNRSWQRTVPLWDATVTGQGRRVQPFFEVSNLLNTYYEDFPGLAEPGRWIRGGVKIRLLGGHSR
ncbi:MAG TPA: TonB-dependent receptor, partial [Bryobacterales bacterium]|nr:TonB-dependent receptor [Bryobacterales bacterium]